MTSQTTAPAEMHAGMWLEGYQAQAQAPVDFIQGSRTRYLDGHGIRGSWSDPWWLYDPARGWAVAKTWRNKDQELLDWTGGGHRAVRIPFAARAEIVVEPYEIKEA